MLNQVSIINEYKEGSSLSDLSNKYGVPRPTLRHHLKRQGVLRSRTEAIRLAASQGKLGVLGPRGPMRASVKAKLREAHKRRWEGVAVGTSTKAKGYTEYTIGEHKGRLVHVVMIEARLGRRLLPDEVVHHIDGNKSNNDINNLALMTRSAHTRLHRREQRIAKGKSC